MSVHAAVSPKEQEESAAPCEQHRTQQPEQPGQQPIAEHQERKDDEQEDTERGSESTKPARADVDMNQACATRLDIQIASGAPDHHITGPP